MSDLAKTESLGKSLARFTQPQIDLIARTVCMGATNDELALFIAICERTGLDPFTRQIYSISRYDKRAGKNVRQTQISIDGARLTAQRSGEYAGQDGPWWCGKDGVWRDVWLDDSFPSAAKIGVLRKGFANPVYAVALFDEYAPRSKDGHLTGQWPQMPALMIAKCAEMLALRKAFPAELSGLYSAEEMAQAEAQAPVADPVTPVPALAPPVTAPPPPPPSRQVVATVVAAPSVAIPPAPKTNAGRKWPDQGTDIFICEKVVDRANGNSAVLCSHATDGKQWVCVGPQLLSAIKLNTAVEIDFQWNKAGFYEATRIGPAPKLTRKEATND